MKCSGCVAVNQKSYCGEGFVALNKESGVKAVSTSFIVFVLLFTGIAQAGSLGKYSSEQQQAPVIQQPSAEQVKQRLNKKIARAIEIVNSLPEGDKSRWIEHYTQRYNAAIEKKNHIEAAYYQGILAGITE